MKKYLPPQILLLPPQKYPAGYVPGREGGKGVVKVINQFPFTSEILNISSKKKNVNRKKNKQMQLFYLLLRAAARKFVILLASRIWQISADYT